MIRNLMKVVLFMMVLLTFVVSVRANEKNISCSNSYLASLMDALLGDEVNCFLILDPRQPEKTSLNTRQQKALMNSSLLFYHPFESWLGKQLEKIEKKHAKKVVTRGRINLSVPTDYLRTAQEMQKSLTKTYPEYSTYMQEMYGQLEESVKNTEIQLLGKTRKSKLVGLACIAGKRQEHYLKWLGLNVVMTFDESKPVDETLLKKIQAKVRDKPIWLVVGDRQVLDGEGSQIIAKAISGEAVLLNGFPVVGRDGEKYSWEDLVVGNAQTLLQTVEWH